MPRGPRLDAPGTLHHVMVRGIEGRAIFRGVADYRDLLKRLEAPSMLGAWVVYAWALLPNHFHLLVRTGGRPLSRTMRSLLTGYAGGFNRRHRRRGHLFQNRYKSIVVEEEPYFLELVRYIHLNPLRAGVVADLAALDRYPHAGHAALLSAFPCRWQDTAAVLANFGSQSDQARRQYRAFIAEGIALGSRPEFQGGGLIRSAGGWAAVSSLRRGREAHTSDERVLGSGAFVEALLHQEEHRIATLQSRQHRHVDLATLVQRIGTTLSVAPAAIMGSNRTPVVVQARQLLAYVWIEHLGRQASELARALGRTRSNITWAAKHGSGLAETRLPSIQEWCR